MNTCRTCGQQGSPTPLRCCRYCGHHLLKMIEIHDEVYEIASVWTVDQIANWNPDAAKYLRDEKATAEYFLYVPGEPSTSGTLWCRLYEDGTFAKPQRGQPRYEGRIAHAIRLGSKILDTILRR